MNAARTRVLIVDDSAVVRGLIARALGSDAEIEIAGTAMHGDAALSWMRKNPVDVVVLDVEMPVMDGLTALKCIMQEFPGVQVVMASSLTRQGAQTTVQALALGAADCIAKPAARNVAESIQQLADRLVPLVKALGRNRAAARSGPTILRGGSASVRRSGGPIQAVVIGASTGGPRALSVLLAGLPPDFPLPILIVQHMPAGFTPMLARHLARDAGRPCTEAVDRGPVLRGNTYVAPGEFHLLVDQRDGGTITRLNQQPPEHYCRPSVNPLFRSASECYGPALLGVMLTGMGEDGLDGAGKLVQNGGHMIAQDEATSVVWGMPAAVVKAGLAHQVLPLDEIAAAVERICLQEAARR